LCISRISPSLPHSHHPSANLDLLAFVLARLFLFLVVGGPKQENDQKKSIALSIGFVSASWNLLPVVVVVCLYDTNIGPRIRATLTRKHHRRHPVQIQRSQDHYKLRARHQVTASPAQRACCASLFLLLEHLWSSAKSSS
jgi:hypothetical protein